MTWKKTWFSRILWACSLAVAVCFLTGICGIYLDRYSFFEKFNIAPGSTRLICLGIFSVLFFAVSLLLFLVIRLIRGRIREKVLPGAAKAAMEGLLFVGLIAGGILLRMWSFPADLESNAYFELAAVKQGVQVAPLAHGALYIYTLLLHGLFLLVGNKLAAGIILQIVLQFLGAVLIYVAVRKTAGAFTAIWTLAFFMFAPIWVKRSLSYTPEVLYLLLFGLGMALLAGVFSKVRQADGFKWYHFLGTLILGIYIAFMVYLDALGIVLGVMSFGLLTVNSVRKEESGEKTGVPALFLILIGIIAGLLGIFWIDARQSGSSLNAIAGVWEWLYVPDSGSFSYMFHQFFDRLSHNPVVAVLLFAGITFGIYSFFVRKHKESQSLWILMSLSGIAVSYVCAASGNMDRSFVAYLGFVILAGKGLINALQSREVLEMPEETEVVEVSETEETIVVNEQEAEEIAETVETVETAVETEDSVEEVNPVEAENLAESDVSAEAEVPAEKPQTEEVPVKEAPVEASLPPVREIKYIENPLPLPKKHVKKKMGYALEINDDQMDFDIEISDDDDFDL